MHDNQCIMNYKREDMKKFLSILWVVLFGTSSVFAQNSVTLTFACQNTDGGYLKPDSIIIENLTRNWSETIYYPDTVYVLNVSTGIPNRPNDNGIQVMPNPFDGTTRMSIQSTKTENVKIKLTDMLGRVCAEFNGLLKEGGNLFSFSLTTPQTYVISVQTSSGIRSLKIENVGRSGANRIVYEGTVDGNMPEEMQKSSSSQEFELGDEMSFTVYAYLNDALVAHQTMTQIQNADDNVVITFPVITDTLNISFCQVSSFNPNETGFDDKVSHVQDYDGNQYQVVQIGSQCWMKENIKATHYSDGTTIPSGGSTNSNTNPYRYAPDNHEYNVPLYGYLYNWAAIMHGMPSSGADPSGVQGICPVGWHVPSSRELWNLPQDGKDIADSLGWETSSTANAVGNNPNLNNSTGFSLRPSGYAGKVGVEGWEYVGFGNTARLWCSEGRYDDEAAYCYLYKDNNVLFGYPTESKSYGFSIRCVRNDLRAEVATDSVTINSDGSVVLKGIVLSDNGNPVLARRFLGQAYVSSSTTPFIDILADSGSDVFYGTMNNIPIGIPYNFCAMAYNDAGWAYGDNMSFSIRHPQDAQSCPNASTVTDYDGNVYHTVQLGTQCWMKENLRTTHYSEGTPILLGNTNSTETPYRYYPHNDPNEVQTYGYLYNWSAVMNGASSSFSIPSGIQGICPTGWHVPSNNEWRLLMNYLYTQSDYFCNSPTNIAKSLADNMGWNISTTTCTAGMNMNSNNTTNFGARPAGYYLSGYNSDFGNMSLFWSATNYNSYYKLSYSFVITNNIPYIRNVENRNYQAGLSVRCIKD